MPRYARAVLGGTFDRLHAGHEALLRTAFTLGRSVAVGVTSDRFLEAHPKPSAGRLQSYATRRAAVRRWIAQNFPGRPNRIVPLEDRFGGSVEPGVGVLVVSAETAGGGRAVNRERRRRGLSPVPLAVVPLVLADDLRPVASRRIRAGEIDRAGHRRSPLPILLTAPDASPFGWALPAVRRAFPGARVERRAAPRSRGGRGYVPLAGLRIDLCPASGDGWVLRESSPAVALDPRPLPGTSPRSWSRGLTAALRPGVAGRGRRI